VIGHEPVSPRPRDRIFLHRPALAVGQEVVVIPSARRHLHRPAGFQVHVSDHDHADTERGGLATGLADAALGNLCFVSGLPRGRRQDTCEINVLRTLTKVNKPSVEVALHAGRSLMKRARVKGHWRDGARCCLPTVPRSVRYRPDGAHRSEV
jgi:hypothetical protein